MDKVKTPVSLALYVTGAVLLIPVWLPIALILNSRNDRRLHAALRRTTCVPCGNRLTDRALEIVQEEADARMAEALRDHSGMRLRMKPLPYTAICAVCGQAYKWLPKQNLFEPVSLEDVAKETSGVST